MLCGAIDVARNGRVAGWMMSPLGSLRGQKVQAFVDAQCVGSGLIEVVRPDLLWLVEDGYAGFNFRVELSPDQDAASIIVKLEHSDAVLLQAESQVRRRPEKDMKEPRPSVEAPGPARAPSQSSTTTPKSGGVVLHYGPPRRSSGAD